MIGTMSGGIQFHSDLKLLLLLFDGRTVVSSKTVNGVDRSHSNFLSRSPRTSQESFCYGANPFRGVHVQHNSAYVVLEGVAVGR